MGTLVFQATLGGSVNLIGPNTASTINFTLPSADGTSGQALATNGSGTLAFSSFATLVSNTFTGSQTLSAGTANGVTYLNGSKVLTSGSALTFDGTTLTQSPASAVQAVTVLQEGGGSSRQLVIKSPAVGVNANISTINTSAAIEFGIGGTEGMRLTSTGLGIGTSSPAAKLHVVNTVYVKGSASSDGDKGITIGSGSGAVNTSSHAIRTGGGLGDLLIIETETANSSGQILFNTNNAERARIDSSGNLLVGTTTTASGVSIFPSFSSAGASGIDVKHVSGSASGTYYETFQYNNSLIGYISQNGTTAVAYNTTSDYRLKENIAPMTGALAKVALLKPVTYKWNADGSDGEGFIAHELAEVVPQCVTGEKDAVDEEGNPKYQGIDTSFLVATLTSALQELNAKFEAYVASHP